MPKELQNEDNFNKTTQTYLNTIKKEPYQPLSKLLNTLNNICKSHQSSLEPVSLV